MSSTATDGGVSSKRTPLYDAHRRLGAKLIDFGGWAMPVSYPAGIIDEHRATRDAVGVFDVCHMGEIHFRGPRAAEAVQRLVTNDVAQADRRARPLHGRLPAVGRHRRRSHRLSASADHYLLIVNASNIEKDRAWFIENVGGCATSSTHPPRPRSSRSRGRAPSTRCSRSTKLSLGELVGFDFVPECEVAGVRAWIARTGYTGEDGFEIFCAGERRAALWERLVEAAAAVGGKPVGLGARDTLRLEGGSRSTATT